MGNRQDIKKRRKKQQSQTNLMLMLMGGGLVLVITAVVISLISADRVNLSVKQIVIPEFTELAQSAGNGLGDPGAPVVIEEFSDFGCSHCADFALETKKLIEQNYIKTGQVYLVYHSVGSLLDSSATTQAAEAAYCAGDQAALWDFHNLIFANQARLFSNRSADISRTMATFADVLGLDGDQFNACMADGKYQSQVASDEIMATQNGISGTPSFLINGTLFIGNQPYENFQQAIADALAISGK